MFKPEMAKMISKAMTLNIHNLSTYDGYNGADILKFEIFDPSVLALLRDYCRNLGYACDTKMPHKKNKPYELFCIVEQSEDVYGIKRS